MSTSIELEFADGSYTFALPLARINELQTKTGLGIGGLFNRVLKGVARIGNQVVLAPAAAEFHVADVIETVRQGLIGGGRGIVDGQEIEVTPAVADRLVKNYALERPLTDAWSIAASVLGACIVGYDPPKKKDPPKPKPKPRTRRKAG